MTKNFFDLPDKQRLAIIKKADEDGTKMQEEMIKKSKLKGEFYKRFVVKSVFGSAINDLGGVDIIWEWIEKQLQAKEKEVVGKIGKIKEYAKTLQKHLCAYRTKHGDGRPCDCKYFMPEIKSQSCWGGEVTGCCEARGIIRILQTLQKEKNDK